MEVQIISGFLGAGKTTFLNRYLPILKGNTVVIENEFGDIGLDKDLIKQEDIPVHEIYAGCICCSLALDFRQGMREIQETFHPDRIVIEPSGVGRLSDIVKACRKARDKDGIDLRITKLIAIVDMGSFEEYAEDFGAFYLDQIQHAGLIFMTRMEGIPVSKKEERLAVLRDLNPKAILCESDFRKLDNQTLMEMLSMTGDYDENPEEVVRQTVPEDKVFSSLAILNPCSLAEDELEEILKGLTSEKWGYVLRAKGIITNREGKKLHFNFTPSAWDYELYEAGHGSQKEVTAEEMESEEDRVVIIGCGLDETALKRLFENSI